MNISGVNMNMKSKFYFVVLSVLLLSVNVLAAPIHDAAKNGDVKKLIEIATIAPQSLYSFCDMGKTPLHWASGKSQLEVINVLINQFKVPVDIQNANKGTPLHVAASQAHPDSLKLLLSNNANMNARAKDGATPLHFASFKTRAGHIECIRLLLKNGCNVNPTMDNGATPLTIARVRGNKEAVELIKQYGGIEGTSNTGKPSGRYDFQGGVAGKRVGEASQSYGNINNNVNVTSSSQMKSRKEMILKRFDINKDGMLDAEERQKAQQMMQKRKKMLYGDN